MEIIRGYKTELDLNNRQRTLCLRHAGAARWTYNFGLQRKQEAYAQRKAVTNPTSVKIPTAIDLHNEISALKQGEQLWLKDVSQWTPQQALRNLDTAFDCFFCEHCDLTIERDLNAALNLKWLYTASSAELNACGEILGPKVLVLAAVSVKQELDSR